MCFRFMSILILLAATSVAQTVVADIIVTGGTILPLDLANSRPEAFAVKDGRILVWGTAEEIRRLQGPRTQMLDATGRTVVPGFNDAHLHARPTYGFASQLGGVDLRPSAVRTMAEIIARLRDKARLVPKGGWIIGERYEDTKLGRHPNRADLDQVSTDHFILLRHSSGHVSVVNSKALTAARITKSTPDPAGGAFDRDANGEPNGVLREGPARNLVLRGCPPFPTATREQEREGLVDTFREYLAKGITSITDAGTSATALRTFQEVVRSGAPAPRINALISAEHLPELKKLNLEQGFGNERLRISGVKIFRGNSLSGATCWVSEPYAGRPDYFGIPPARSQAELNALIGDSHAAGLQVAVHSNGDREITMVLEAIAAAQASLPRPDARHRIEHASIMPVAMMRRAKDLGLILALHSYLYEHGDKMEVYGEDRFAILHAARTAWDLGIRIPGNSDSPVSAADPLLRIQSLVTRRSAEGKVYAAQQRLTAEEALRSFTVHSAFASFEEQAKGTLEPGKLADFVVLSANPLEVNSERIKDIRVERTFVGGRQMYPVTR